MNVPDSLGAFKPLYVEINSSFIKGKNSLQGYSEINNKHF